jgi:hypothetical protein
LVCWLQAQETAADGAQFSSSLGDSEGVGVRDEDKTKEQLMADLRAVREQLAEGGSAVPEPRASADAAERDAWRRAVTDDQRLVCRWRPDGTLTFVSEAYCQHFGKGRDELIGWSFWPLVAEVDRARVLEHVRGLGPHNPAGILEHRVLGPEGQVRWHLRVDHVLAEEDGQPAEYETVARDITEQQQLRAELRMREASIRAFFDCATEGIVAVNRRGQIVLANPRAEVLFGYERAELTGLRLEVLIPDRVRSVHGQYQADYFARPRTRPMGLGLTLTGRRKDGTEFPIEVSLTHLPDEAGGLVMAFVTDISERVARERQTRHVEKLAALGSLAAGIAHELNNPIGIILSRIELMLMEGEEQPHAAESVTDLQVLHRHAQRLSRIAQGLLSFGRQRQRDRRPLDLSEVVEDTLLLGGKQLSREGIHVLTRLDAGLPRMLGDPTALEQVLLNLLFNARDAMPTGGTVEIETSTDPAQPGTIRLVVSDTGHGMSPDILAKLAEPFFTTKSSGSGLGLSVSYTIIREHGGTVQVRSEPGRGTTFTILFPPA